MFHEKAHLPARAGMWGAPVKGNFGKKKRVSFTVGGEEEPSARAGDEPGQ